MRESSHPHIGFLTFAKQFASAASQTKKTTPLGGSVSLVGYFLFGHAVELGLKSFLIKVGYSQNRLRDIGHDLQACLSAARESGIEQTFVTPELVACVDLMNEYYSKKEFEYFFHPKGMRLPEADALECAVNHLLAKLHALYIQGLREERNSEVT